MTPEERLALINEVSQRILSMPEAERQAYTQANAQAINDMLNEYQELSKPRQSGASDPITQRTPEQQAALSGDQPTQEAPKQRRKQDRRQDRRQDIPDAEGTPKTEENEGPVIVRQNSDGTVTDDKGNNYIVDNKGNIIGSAAGTGNQADTDGTGSNTVTPKGSSNNSGTDAPMWPLYGLGGLAALGAYGAMRGINAKNKPKVIPPGTDIKALGQQGVKGNVPEPKTSAPKTHALGEVREGKLVNEGLLSDGKVIVQGPKGNLPDKRNTSISQIMSRPGVYEPVEGYHTPADIAAKSKNRISQIMSRPGIFEPVEGYHTPADIAAKSKNRISQIMSRPGIFEPVEGYHTTANTAVETAAEKGTKNAVKKGVKNAAKKGAWSAVKKGAKKALPKFIQKAIF